MIQIKEGYVDFTKNAFRTQNIYQFKISQNNSKSMNQEEIKQFQQLLLRYKKSETEGNTELYDQLDRVQFSIKKHEQAKKKWRESIEL